QPQRFPSTVVIGDGTGPARAVFRTSPRVPQSLGGPVTLESPRMSAAGDWTAFEMNGGSGAYNAVDSNLGSRDTALLLWRSIGSSDVAGDGVVVFQGTQATGPRALYTFGGSRRGQIIPGSEVLPGGTVAMNDGGDIALLEGS